MDDSLLSKQASDRILEVQAFVDGALYQFMRHGQLSKPASDRILEVQGFMDGALQQYNRGDNARATEPHQNFTMAPAYKLDVHSRRLATHRACNRCL